MHRYFRYLFYLVIFRQCQTIHQLRVRNKTLDVLLNWKVKWTTYYF